MRPLDHAAWLRWLQHRDEDPYVGKIYESILAYVRKSRTQPVTRFGLSMRQVINPSTSKVAVVRALAAAARGLNAPLPLLFIRPDAPGGLAHVPAEPIASIVGAGLMSGRGLAELAFVAGQHMAMYRPDRYVHVLYASVADLTTLFLAALRIGQPGLAVTAEVAMVSRQLRARMASEPAAVEHVARVVELFVKRDEPVQLARWLEGVRRTALRAGLLLCGDLAVAQSLISLLPDVTFDAMDDLVLFALSEEYAALRQHTGLALWPDQTDAARDAAVGSDASALHSVDIPIDAFGAGSDDALHSIEISLDELGASHGSALDSVDVPLDDVEAPMVAHAGALHSVEIRLDDLGIRPDPTITDARADASFGSTEVDILAPASPQFEAPASAAYAHDHPDAALRERFLEASAAGDMERAHAIASVLVHRLGEKAPEAMIAMVATRRAREAFAEGVRLDEAAWNIVTDPGERGAAGAFMCALEHVFAAAMPRTPEDYGFDRNFEATQSVPLAAAIRWAARSIGAPVPLVFVAEEQPRLLGRPSADPPIAVVNPVLATTLTLAEMAFIALEHVAYERPERRARVRLGDASSLIRVAFATHAFVTTGQSPDVADPHVARALGVLTARADLCAMLQPSAAAMRASTLVDEVTAWCLATEHTAARAAIASVLDLDAAARALSLDRGQPMRVLLDEKLAALERFVLGEAFAALRVARGW